MKGDVKNGVSQSSKMTVSELLEAFRSIFHVFSFAFLIDSHCISKDLSKNVQVVIQLLSNKNVMAKILREAILYGNLCVRKGLNFSGWVCLHLSNWVYSDHPSSTFFLKSRLQSHVVAVNFGVFWWWAQHTLPTWGLGFAMCLVHQLACFSRDFPETSDWQIMCIPDTMNMFWIKGIESKVIDHVLVLARSTVCRRRQKQNFRDQVNLHLAHEKRAKTSFLAGLRFLLL